MDEDERELLAFLLARDDVSDDELVARVKAAPDVGGALLVELAEFLVRCAQKSRESCNVTETTAMKSNINVEAQIVLSDAYLDDARFPIQSERHRLDCAFDSGYHALLAVLTEAERTGGDNARVEAVRIACARLGLDVVAGVHRAQQRYGPEECDDLAAVFEWAETVRLRAKKYLETK